MTRQVEVIEESQVKEINDIRVLYDKEVRDLKAAIEELSKNYKDLQNSFKKSLMTDELSTHNSNC